MDTLLSFFATYGVRLLAIVYALDIIARVIVKITPTTKDDDLLVKAEDTAKGIGFDITKAPVK